MVPHREYSYISEQVFIYQKHNLLTQSVFNVFAYISLWLSVVCFPLFSYLAFSFSNFCRLPECIRFLFFVFFKSEQCICKDVRNKWFNRLVSFSFDLHPICGPLALESSG